MDPSPNTVKTTIDTFSHLVWSELDPAAVTAWSHNKAAGRVLRVCRVLQSVQPAAVCRTEDSFPAVEAASWDQEAAPSSHRGCPQPAQPQQWASYIYIH